MAERLDGTRILILETREEAQFSRLLKEKGAYVLQCPMFTIEDVSDTQPVAGWVARYVANPFDDLVLMTGEGLRRILKLVRQHGGDTAFIEAVAQSRKFARGPKPGKALREIGLAPDVITEKPTSEGIAEMLATYDLKGHRVGLQLYPEKDHSALIGAIEALGADVDTVLPYIYDSKAADSNILAAIDEMESSRIDAIALTSSGQVRRLVDAARAHGREEQLRSALAKTAIASVGPVVSDELQAHGLHASITPAENAFFMRPLISAMSVALGKSAARNATA